MAPRFACAPAPPASISLAPSPPRSRRRAGLQQLLQPRPKEGKNDERTARFDIHQQITNQIVAAIDAGAGEFRLPWHRSAGNILALWAAGDAKGYESGTWGTYKQWAEAGAQVRKGERASHVVFYKETTVAADEGSEDETGTRLFARATPVFAAEQVEGYAAPALPEPPANPVEPIERAEAFVAATGAIIHHGGSLAFYRRSTDNIHLPTREAFIGTATSTAAEAYYVGWHFN